MQLKGQEVPTASTVVLLLAGHDLYSSRAASILSLFQFNNPNCCRIEAERSPQPGLAEQVRGRFKFHFEVVACPADLEGKN